jgi:hypothetical protein
MMNNILKYERPNKDYDGPTLEYVQKEQPKPIKKGELARFGRAVKQVLLVTGVVLGLLAVVGGIMLGGAYAGEYLGGQRGAGLGMFGGGFVVIVISAIVGVFIEGKEQ